MSGEAKPCARCGQEPAGDGGILGASCLRALEARTLEDMYGKAAGDENHH